MSCRQLEKDIWVTFGLSLSEAQVSTLETVGQLHDLVRAEFAGHLLSEPLVMSRFVALTAVRRALRAASAADVESVGFRTPLESLLPKENRGSNWRILKRELDGVLPPLTPSRRGLIVWWSSFWLAISSPLLIMLVSLVSWEFHLRLDNPVWPAFWFVDSILFCVGVTWYVHVNGTHFPSNCTMVAEVLELWCGHVSTCDRHLPNGERELWYLFKKIIADNSGCKRDQIGRESRFADLGIE